MGEKGASRTPPVLSKLSTFASASTVRKNTQPEGAMDFKALLSEHTARLEAGMKAHFGELSDKVEGLTQEMKKMSENQRQMEKKIVKMDTECKTLHKKTDKTEGKVLAVEKHQEELEDKIASIEMKVKDSWVRVRALPEGEEGKDLKAFMVNMIMDLLQETDAKLVEGMLVTTYRLNSTFARDNKLPRDCIIQFGTRSFRDLVLQEHFKNPIFVGPAKLILMKEIPVRILRKRKNFAFLVEKLEKKGIKFSWQFPQGLSFYYKKKQIVRDVESAESFLRKYKKDFDGDEEPSTSLSPRSQKKKIKQLKGAEAYPEKDQDQQQKEREDQEEEDTEGGEG